MAKKLRYIFAKNMKIARLGMDLSQEKLGEIVIYTEPTSGVLNALNTTSQ